MCKNYDYDYNYDYNYNYNYDYDYDYDYNHNCKISEIFLQNIKFFCLLGNPTLSVQKTNPSKVNLSQPIEYIYQKCS